MKKFSLLFSLLCISLFSLAQSNQYLHFDRDNQDYVLTPDASDLVSNSTEITMMGWFYTDELVYGQGMMGFRSGTNGFYLIQLDNGVIECRYNSSTGLDEYVAPAFTVIPEQWQHFAWVYDGNNIKLYVDGVLNGSAAASGIITESGIPFAIGRSILSNLDFYFGGRADEVSLWNTALNENEIAYFATDELTGTETGLQLYYKFNQGVPADDNTSISHTTSEIGSPERDGELINFMLNGPTSNFNGDFDVSFQAISFPILDNKLTTDASFNIIANASSGLPVDFTVVSGPATITGNTVTLTGSAGSVVIEANQIGDAYFTPASPIQNSFDVIDPQTNTPNIDIRNPLEGTVQVPQIGAIHLAAIVDIDYTELFSVQTVQFEIGNEVIPAYYWKDGHYTAYWTPTDFGTYSITARAFNNFGASSTSVRNVNVMNSSTSVTIPAFSDIVINTAVSSQTVSADLPSFMGAYDHVTATLDVSCPPGQPCGEWDRVARVMLKTHEGEWIEVIKYITPYGSACDHTVDLTDFISALQGRIDFRVECGTFDTGYSYALTLDYNSGTPQYKYSFISKMWHDTYDFGNYANLQPVEVSSFEFADNALASTLKLVSSGHGWGDLNSNNAAEFSENTHHILINDVETFTQHNWETCNPNPDGCQPQAGTWYFDRAGWCPGAIASWFDFNLTPYIASQIIDLKYRFDESYVDFCNSNHPDCITGVTCDDCDDGFNPVLIVASSIVSFSDTPFEGTVATVGIEDQNNVLSAIDIFPNPTNGKFRIVKLQNVEISEISISDASGRILKKIAKPNFNANGFEINLSYLENGIYYVFVNGNEFDKIMMPVVLTR